MNRYLTFILSGILSVILSAFCFIPVFATDNADNAQSTPPYHSDETSAPISVNFIYNGNIVSKVVRAIIPGFTEDKVNGGFIGNYSMFLGIKPDGYTIVSSGDFLWDGSSVLDVEVIPEAEDKSINYIFTFENKTIKSGNFTICGLIKNPDNSYTLNYSIFDSLIPEGFTYDLCGDFFWDGCSVIEISLNKIPSPTKSVTVNYILKDTSEKIGEENIVVSNDLDSITPDMLKSIPNGYNIDKDNNFKINDNNTVDVVVIANDILPQPTSSPDNNKPDVKPTTPPDNSGNISPVPSAKPSSTTISPDTDDYSCIILFLSTFLCSLSYICYYIRKRSQT